MYMRQLITHSDSVEVVHSTGGGEEDMGAADGAHPCCPHWKNYLLTSTQKTAWIHCHNIHILLHACVLSTHQCTNLVNTTQTIVWVVHKLLCEHNNHCEPFNMVQPHYSVCLSHNIFCSAVYMKTHIYLDKTLYGFISCHIAI